MSADASRNRNAQRIARISLSVADMAGTSAFYERALGFQPLKREARAGAAEVAILRLGQEEIELVRYDPVGAAYPAPRAANDPWFQHFAIVVSDMTSAYARLAAHGGSEPISRGGPQQLPPSTGSVTAYKFRDPEGHPLELSFFPPGVGDARWQARDRLCLGIDHSGLAVRDLAPCVSFYRDLLGFADAPILVNTGPTQARLDGLDDPTVDIVALSPPAGPHIELLAYRGLVAPQSRARDVREIAATQLVIEVRDLGALASRLSPFLVRPSPGQAWPGAPGQTTLCRDPSGHLLRLEQM